MKAETFMGTKKEANEYRMLCELNKKTESRYVFKFYILSNYSKKRAKGGILSKTSHHRDCHTGTKKDYCIDQQNHIGY